MNDTSRNYRFIRQHSNHNGGVVPYLGPFNKTIKENSYRNINARGISPWFFFHRGKLPQEWGRRAADLGPKRRGAELGRRGAEAQRRRGAEAQRRRVRAQGAENKPIYPVKQGAEPRTGPQGSCISYLGPRICPQRPTQPPDRPQTKLGHVPWTSLLSRN